MTTFTNFDENNAPIVMYHGSLTEYHGVFKIRTIIETGNGPRAILDVTPDSPQVCIDTQRTPHYVRSKSYMPIDVWRRQETVKRVAEGYLAASEQPEMRVAENVSAVRAAYIARARAYLSGVIDRIEEESDRITLAALREGFNANVGQTVTSEQAFAVVWWDDETLADLRNTIREISNRIEH